MEEEVKTVVVIDAGSNTIKAGFAGDDAPRKIFPSYVGYTKKHPINLAMDENAYYVGDDARERRGRLTMKRPIERKISSSYNRKSNATTTEKIS